MSELAARRSQAKKWWLAKNIQPQLLTFGTKKIISRGRIVKISLFLNLFYEYGLFST